MLANYGAFILAGNTFYSSRYKFISEGLELVLLKKKLEIFSCQCFKLIFFIILISLGFIGNYLFANLSTFNYQFRNIISLQKYYNVYSILMKSTKKLCSQNKSQ